MSKKEYNTASTTFGEETAVKDSNNESHNDSIIYLSVSKVDPGQTKSVSTGFDMVEFKTLKGIAKVWRHYSLSSAIYSKMKRWDKYKRKWIHDRRRRNHNISLIGNTFIYDFDDGLISMSEFIERYEGKFKFLAVKSKNDHKYDHDRFKVLVVHDTIFVQNTKTDTAPDGYEVLNIKQYQDSYIGFAEYHKFWQYADQSTKDMCRLASNVGKEYVKCQRLD